MNPRPWVARLVRETLACSKKLAHHIGAVTASMCQYTLRRSTAFPREHSRKKCVKRPISLHTQGARS
jgi:hypothetical protein